MTRISNDATMVAIESCPSSSSSTLSGDANSQSGRRKKNPNPIKHVNTMGTIMAPGSSPVVVKRRRRRRCLESIAVAAAPGGGGGRSVRKRTQPPVLIPMAGQDISQFVFEGQHFRNHVYIQSVYTLRELYFMYVKDAYVNVDWFVDVNSQTYIEADLPYEFVNMTDRDLRPLCSGDFMFTYLKQLKKRRKPIDMMFKLFIKIQERTNQLLCGTTSAQILRTWAMTHLNFEDHINFFKDENHTRSVKVSNHFFEHAETIYCQLM